MEGSREAMAMIRLVRPALPPLTLIRPLGRRVLRLRVRFRVGGDGKGEQGSEEDAPESLFAKELRRRRMAPGSAPKGEKAGVAAGVEEGERGGEAGRNCMNLFLYTRGAANIRCSRCNRVNSTRSGTSQIAHLMCGQCRTTLMMSGLRLSW